MLVQTALALCVSSARACLTCQLLMNPLMYLFKCKYALVLGSRLSFPILLFLPCWRRHPFSTAYRHQTGSTIPLQRKVEHGNDVLLVTQCDLVFRALVGD